MIYSQFQAHQPFANRFAGARGLLMFAAGIAVLALGLILLPLLFLAAAISTLVLATFGRQWLKGKLAARQASHDGSAFGRFRFDDSFQPRPHQGRTFDHDPAD
ncbi:hypothetical protein JYB88_17445 [Shewanella cyperi]|uniref:Uncharacterized protein n=2 Tax=Shewanella TaxID=22 RepID=A0A975AK26_9GAMM|nr:MULTISPECIES: hypothetical protein [Shewanella]QSX29937.1 hypothetical protein JYB88_17445 [Shewanella cyperi]QSX37116.1 hypothetical protein JYB85_18000 [Shewanella sedimentimangrovi]